MNYGQIGAKCIINQKLAIVLALSFVTGLLGLLYCLTPNV
jgi:hypothetical protein